MNEDRPVLSATVLYPIKCTFQRCIGYVDITGHSFAMGRQTSTGWGKSYVRLNTTRQMALHDG